jgi:uncharacterized coiled-coil protein SlyX
MKNTYDSNRAQELVPLLRSISLEISERLHEIRVLQGRISATERQAGQDDQVLDLKAALATHRREVRLAQRELEHLGCVLDEDRPFRILIPGIDGDVSHGFAWDANDPHLRRVSTGTAVG